jgi:hypothetical protein
LPITCRLLGFGKLSSGGEKKTEVRAFWLSSRLVFAAWINAGAWNTGALRLPAGQPQEGEAMKRRLTICLLLAAAVPGLAAAGSNSQIRELANATGLTERQVLMVFGPHTAYFEYLTSYDWARRRIVKALGTERYEDLMAGREIQLDNGQRVAVLGN